MRKLSYWLYNHEVTVLYLPEVIDDDGDKVFGTCDMQECILRIATHSPHDGTPLSQTVIDHNFWHEFVHSIMYFADPKFDKDETKVDRVGALLAQAEKTMKHEELP